MSIQLKGVGDNIGGK